MILRDATTSNALLPVLFFCLFLFCFCFEIKDCPSCPGTHRDLCASASHLLGLQAWPIPLYSVSNRTMTHITIKLKIWEQEESKTLGKTSPHPFKTKIWKPQTVTVTMDYDLVDILGHSDVTLDQQGLLDLVFHQSQASA